MSNLDKVKAYLSGVAKNYKIGYTPEVNNFNHAEGKIWKDSSGNEWTIKNGVRTQLPKKSKLVYRQICKNCGRDIRFSNLYYLDSKTWLPTGLCHECFFKNETKMKENGTWEEFNKKRTLENEYSVIKDYIKKFEEALEWCKRKKTEPITFFNSDGTSETWKGTENLDELEKNISSDLDTLYERLKKVESNLKALSNKNNKKP